MKILTTLLLTLSFNFVFCQFTRIDSLTLEFFEEWKNVPYKFGGDSKKGIDCSKFTRRYYRNVFGFDIPPTCAKQYQAGLPIDTCELQVGDLIYFTSKVSPSGWHCGVYIGNDEFIHAANYKQGIIKSCLLDPKYKRILKGYRRFFKSDYNTSIQNNSNLL